MTDKIRTEKTGAVGWVVFNNPARHNAVSLEMWQGADDALRGFQADDTVRLIAITGAGDQILYLRRRHLQVRERARPSRCRGEVRHGLHRVC